MHVRTLSRQYFRNVLTGRFYKTFGFQDILLIFVIAQIISFIQTGQQDILNSSSLPGIVDGMRKICGLGSAVLGNVSGVNGAPPAPSSTINGVLKRHHQLSPKAVTISLIAFTLFLGSLGL